MTPAHATDLWLGELGGSPRTRDTYRRLLNKLADDYPSLDVANLTSTMMRQFLHRQAVKQDGSPKSERRSRRTPLSSAPGWTG